MGNEIGCLDCGSVDMPIDTVLTVYQWEMICPEGGVLCASCIVRRAQKLPNVMNVCARIIFMDDYDGDEPGGRFFQGMKRLDPPDKQFASAK